MTSSTSTQSFVSVAVLGWLAVAIALWAVDVMVYLERVEAIFFDIPLQARLVDFAGVLSVHAVFSLVILGGAGLAAFVTAAAAKRRAPG